MLGSQHRVLAAVVKLGDDVSLGVGAAVGQNQEEGGVDQHLVVDPLVRLRGLGLAVQEEDLIFV